MYARLDQASGIREVNQDFNIYQKPFCKSKLMNFNKILQNDEKIENIYYS